MKIVYLFLFSFILLTSSTCKKEGDDCHYKIEVTNNSAESVFSAIPLYKENNQCRLDGKMVLPDGEHEYEPYNFCIEKSMGANDRIVIYIVNAEDFNPPGEYYDCDSIGVNNDILETYDLSLSDLKNIDFQINYP